MISIYLIITTAATTALAQGLMECDLSESTGDQQCFGVVGEPVIFILPNTTNKNIQLIKDEKQIIFKIVNNQIKTLQYGVFTNQTFKLDKAMKTHSGDYQMEAFGLQGNALKKVKVHLEIKDPVSEPAVSQMCLSPEQMKVSCSSDGEEVKFILSLDGYELMQTRTHSQSTVNATSLTGIPDEQDQERVSSVSISLHGQLTGNFMCQVHNNFSRSETVINLKSCKEFGSCFPVVAAAVTASGATLLLLVALCLGIKHLHKKRRPTTVNEDNSDNEIIYAHVTVRKNTRKTQPTSGRNAR